MNALDARAASPDDAEGPDDAHGAAIGEAVDSTTRHRTDPQILTVSGRDVELLPAPAAVAAVAE